jgi:hypothetical protein
MKRAWIFLLLPSTALAANVIEGTVVDRNGKPLERVNVALDPGNVELVSDQDGTFHFDYLRDSTGNRVKLSRRTEYKVTYFKVGYHPESTVVEYKHGDLVLEPVTLKEDTIRVDPSLDNIDPGQFPDKAQNSGGSYEGE